MPRNVRNFWIEIEVDGKKEKIATGPKAADGGFTMKIFVRENGNVSDNAVLISGTINPQDKLFILATTTQNQGRHNTILMGSKR